MRAILTSSYLLLLLGCNDSAVSVYNTPPSVSILSPSDGERFDGDAVVELHGLAKDSQDASEDLQISWSSGELGELGSGSPDANGDVFLPIAGLPSGEHVITFTAFDSSAEASSEYVTIQIGEVEDGGGDDPDPEPETPPTVVLVGPSDGDSFVAGEWVDFVGTATDGEQSWDTLLASLVSDQDGTLWEGQPTADGRIDFSTDLLTSVEHVVTLTVVDDDGNIGVDSTTFTVVADGRPEATITNPVAGQLYWTDESVLFEGLVADDQTDAEILAVNWSTDVHGVVTDTFPDSSGYTATSSYLAEATHVVTLTVLDEEGKDASDTVTIEVIDPNNYDDDGDGYTENEDDCDDGDATVNPGEAEQCDDIDNDCDGDVNEDWWDSYEPNDATATGEDLGEVDVDVGWGGSQISLAGLTLHEDVDEDWFLWSADDEWYDNVDINVSAQSFPAAGTYVLELYLYDGGTWRLKDSDQGSGKLIVTHAGDLFDTDEDDWAVRIYAATWPASSCSFSYTLDIES